ncbi:hypothetical protein ElyMa_003524400 [Elysia marginata]|uniref:Potassium channel tetramerisation-type BTB domain-containing protein n=1 Tax=Elysia marginata TaxID=1093978 RepID=A0AAV4EHS6_9GAST|nr:hypothetical protein ElyMa_003524400 [Elysia marginata]
MENRQITINVGGQVFYTSTHVLRTIPNSLLNDLCDPSVTLEQAMEFPDKGFRHGTPNKDLKTYDTSPEAPRWGFGVKEDKGQVSPARAALKEKLNRAKFVYISCNSSIRHIRRRKPTRTTTTSVSSSSSSSSSSLPLSSSSPTTDSPRVSRPDFSEASPTTTLSWSTSPSYPPPYPAATLLPPPVPLYYPVTNAIGLQEDRLVFTEKQSSANNLNDARAHITACDNAKSNKTLEQTHRRNSSKKEGAKKSHIDKYPLLDVSPQTITPSPEEPVVYIDPGQVNNGFHPIYEEPNISNTLSFECDYNFSPLDSGGCNKTQGSDIHNTHQNFSFFHRTHSYHPNRQNHNSQSGELLGDQPQGKYSPSKTQTDPQATILQAEDYQISGQHQYDHNHQHNHHSHQNHQQQSQQQHQPQHLYEVYQQPSLISFPFPPAGQADIYIDRNPSLFPFILDAYRIGVKFQSKTIIYTRRNRKYSSLS